MTGKAVLEDCGKVGAGPTSWRQAFDDLASEGLGSGGATPKGHSWRQWQEDRLGRGWSCSADTSELTSGRGSVGIETR